MSTRDPETRPAAGGLDQLADEGSDGAPEPVRTGHRVVFARMGRNIGWLLGGRGFAGAVSIAFLAMAVRALGPAGFGSFALVLARLLDSRSRPIRIVADHHPSAIVLRGMLAIAAVRSLRSRPET